MEKNILPEGMRDLLFKDCIKKNFIIEGVNEVFSKWGYEEIITPSIEYYTTFLTNGRSIKEEELYKFFDNQGRILVMRGDMTIPIARVAATKLKDVQAPLRLCYTANVYRVHESLGGKRNEFTDCGVEFLGGDKIESNLEVLLIALESIKNLNINDLKLEIGDINIFNSALSGLDLTEEEREKLAQLVENKSLKELENYLNKLDFKEAISIFFKRLPWLFGGDEVLEEALKLSFNDELTNSINEIKALFDILKSFGYEKNISLDLGMVPGENYYTGLIFKGYVNGVGHQVLRGGRYDNLLKGFGRDMEAVGFSLNIDGLVDLISYEEKREKVILYYEDNDLLEKMKIAIKLRVEGKKVVLIKK
ncbi:MAG: ATP phosphoribosyltransferase regulatory subunit [Clostridium sp.]